MFSLYATGVVDTTGGKFAAGVVDTGGEFSKKLEMTLMLLSEAWGKMIHEKNPDAKKPRDTVPLICAENYTGV